MTAEEEIQQDLNWREAEMASLKLLLASAARGSDRQRALLRACCAMLYAHYEGFSKFCWTLLAAKISAGAHRRNELIEPLAKFSLMSDFRKIRGNTSDDALWDFGAVGFSNLLSEAALLSDEIDTQSNLWPQLSQKINESFGLSSPYLSLSTLEIQQLVGRRNKIAHGEKLEISTLEQFQRFEHAAILVMHELALGVADALSNQSFLKSRAS